jgi:hypothetical protein
VKIRSCAETQSELVESLGQPLRADRQASLDGHLALCTDCAASLAELRAGWETFRELPPLEPPPELHARTRDAVLREMAADELAETRAAWIRAGQVPLAIGSALLVAAATLLVLGGSAWGSALPQAHLFFCAALFTGLLVGAFSWIYSATTVNGLHLDAAARIGVLALAITVAATTACPEFHVLAWWDRSALGRFFTGEVGEGGSSIVFGFAYGLVPGFLAALFGGQILAERPVANSLVAAAVVFLLALPVVFLQSTPFAAGVIASWVGGIAAGTLCGVVGAFRVRQRVAQIGHRSPA